MKPKLILLIPKKPLTYARYLSLTTGIFIDKIKSKEDYKKIYSHEATEEALTSKNNTILISDHIIHMQEKSNKSFSHELNKERYTELLLNLFNSNKEDINVAFVDLDKDNSFFLDETVIIIPGIFYNNKFTNVDKKYKSGDSYYNVCSINSSQIKQFSTFEYSKLDDQLSININKAEYTKFFKKLFIQGQDIQPGINLIKKYNVKNTPITKTFISQTKPKNYDNLLKIFIEMLDNNYQDIKTREKFDHGQIKYVNEKLLQIESLKENEKSEKDLTKSYYLSKFKNLTSKDLDGNDFLEMFDKIDTDIDFTFDFFISHQSRDKHPFVMEMIQDIKEKYSNKGLYVNIWYDNYLLDLNIKNSWYYRSAIYHGLSHSKNIIVLITYNYWDKLIENGFENDRYINHFENECGLHELTNDNSLEHYVAYSYKNKKRICKNYEGTNSFYFGVNYELSVLLNKEFYSLTAERQIPINLIRFDFGKRTNFCDLKLYNFKEIKETDSSLQIGYLLCDEHSISKCLNNQFTINLLDYKTSNFELKKIIKSFLIDKL